MRALLNLKAQVTFSVLPWEWKPEKPIDDAIRKDKKLRHGWITDTFTQHCCYSAVEGLNENERVTKPKGDNEGNPPHLIYAYVADYDKFKLTQEMVLSIARGATIPPSWYEVTLSGYARFIWLFEKPIRVSGWKMAKAFLQKLTEVLGAKSMLPGLDPASEEPQQYWTNSTTWIEIGGKPVSYDQLMGALVTVASDAKGLEDSSGPSIPLEEVATALRAKYPTFNDWIGDFTVGAQGPSFWVPNSESVASAVVKADGMYTFSGHATQVFFSWADLLGKAWVDKYEGESLGKLVTDIYFDPKASKYQWPLDGGKAWIPLSARDIELQLLTKRGADSKADKSGVSQVSRALSHIQTEQWIRGSAPFVFMPTGLIEYGPSKERYLNTARNTPVDPADAPQTWGESGGFPFISWLFDTLFGDTEQRTHFLSELSYFYTWSWKRDPRPGHLIVLAGNTGIGKSFLVNNVIGELMGGCIDATRYLLEGDTFTAPYLHVGVWTVDDGNTGDSQAARNQASTLMKRVVANSAHVCNEKFGSQVKVEWMGRPYLTTNLDEESIRVIPEITSSNQDKFCVYLLSDAPSTTQFDADRSKNNTRVRSELRAFARFLMDWQIPAHLLTERRFGLRTYISKSVLAKTRANADSAFLTELIEDWRREYFATAEGKTLSEWRGTTTQLMRVLTIRDQSFTPLTRSTPQQVAAHLRRMSSVEGAIVSALHTTGGHENLRLWLVHRPDDMVRSEPAYIPDVNTPEAAVRFQK